MRVWLLLLATVAAVATKASKCAKCSKTEDDTSKNTCLSACEPSCENPIQDFCTLNCVQRPCTCKTGYYRNEAKKCVPWKDCPQLNPCAATSCTVGAICVEEQVDCGNPPCPTRGRCTAPPTGGKIPTGPSKPSTKCAGKPSKPKPSKPSHPGTKPAPSGPSPSTPSLPAKLTCENYPCRHCGDTCQMVHDDATCKTDKCESHPECMPLSSPTCWSTDCAFGNVCRMIPVTCVTCPCYPQPTCVPSSSNPTSCGKNETLNKGCVECDKLCPGQTTPEPCFTICDIDACRCSDGFYRDQETKKCITLNDCQSKTKGYQQPTGYDRKKKVARN